MKPEVLAVMARGKEEAFRVSDGAHENPSLLLSAMNEHGIDRVGMVNYPSPNIMGFDDEHQRVDRALCRGGRRRLLPYGGVDPLTDAEHGGVEHLVESGQGSQDPSAA